VHEPRYAVVDVDDLTNSIGFIGSHAVAGQVAAGAGDRYQVVEITEVPT
jgi:hypothetical protein